MNLNFEQNSFEQFVELFEKMLKVYNVPYKKLDNFFISTENIKLSPIELKIKNNIKTPLDQKDYDLLAFTDSIKIILDISQVVNMMELVCGEGSKEMNNLETQLCNIIEFLSIFMSKKFNNKDLDNILESLNITKMA